MILYSIQISQVRLLRNEIELIDTTVKSSSPDYYRLFAPPNFKLVMDYKTGKITEEEYTEKYLEKLIKSSQIFEEEWLEFLKKEKVALGCYCKSGKFCHRHLLVKFILEFCSERDIDISYEGELNGK